MKFEFGKKYTLIEIEQLAGSKPKNCYEGSKLYCVVDINGDFAQYDFRGDPDCLNLLFVDGKPGKGE